jgi:hypothetical protein
LRITERREIDMFIGALIGLAIGYAVCYFFIFPTDLLSIKLVNLTIGDVLRILGGLVVILITTIVGGNIGSFMDDKG